MNKALNILFVLSCFCSLRTFAQSQFPSTYSIETDTAYTLWLSYDNWQILEDKDGKWTIDDVSNPPLSNNFHNKGKPALIEDSTQVKTFWTRYRLTNTMDHDAKISLTSFADLYDVYVQEENTTRAHYRSGFQRSRGEKDGLIFVHELTYEELGPGALPLVLKPGEEILIYDRRHRVREVDFDVNVRLLNTEKLIENYYLTRVDKGTDYYPAITLQESFMIGLLFLGLFFNALFYSIVKEKVYLYFALYAFFLILNRMWNISYAYLSHENPPLSFYVPYLRYAWAFIAFCLVQFYRHFLRLKLYYPKWDKILFGLAVANSLLFVIQFSLTLYQSPLANYFVGLISLSTYIVIPLSILITLILFLRSKALGDIIMIWGSLPLILLYLLSSFNMFSFIDEYYRIIELVCLTWFVLSLTATLMLRFVQMRKENEAQLLANEKLEKEKEIQKNELIGKQKLDLEREVTERTADLKRSLHELKSAQAQLVQSEKMASLGELTAGIAHEIQNPLNFVNNFSEVSSELVDEASAELNKGEIEETRAILGDLKGNLDKIKNHGQRASTIVKGMLEHSRTSSGKKELTDINALAEEYLRLAYHGLRAKDKSFNSNFKTDLDPNLPKIDVVPQDIGRVLLNLINNAFQACSALSIDALNASIIPLHAASLDEEGAFNAPRLQPTVSVSTKQMNGSLEISIEDNGCGIPDEIKDKIFQPFFTTKPTGQGTGLGLSLAYDIVKAHGGEIRVESRQDLGTKFTITLFLI